MLFLLIVLGLIARLTARLEFEPLCLSTQSVIFLRLKLKRGLNALLPAHVGLGAPAFEYSIRDFFEAQFLMCCFAECLRGLHDARLMSDCGLDVLMFLEEC
jgi:hypothetical protein